MRAVRCWYTRLTFCIKLHNDGYGTMSTQEYFDDELDPAQWDLILQNDYFYAGQALPLLQVSGQLPDDFRYLSSDEAQLQAFYAAMDKVSVAPRVGAVLKGDFSFPGIYGGGISLITTEKGCSPWGCKPAAWTARPFTSAVIRTLEPRQTWKPAWSASACAGT